MVVAAWKVENRDFRQKQAWAGAGAGSFFLLEVEGGDRRRKDGGGRNRARFRHGSCGMLHQHAWHALSHSIPLSIYVYVCIILVEKEDRTHT